MTGARPYDAARFIATSATTASASSTCSCGAELEVGHWPVHEPAARSRRSGPGDPNSAPSGWPVDQVPGRSDRHASPAGARRRAPGSAPGAARTLALRRGRTGRWASCGAPRSRAASRSGDSDAGARQQQPVDERVVQRLPRRLDDVLAHPDGRPGAIAVGGVDQHTGDRTRALRGVEHAHLVIGEVHVVECRGTGRRAPGAARRRARSPARCPRRWRRAAPSTWTLMVASVRSTPLARVLAGQRSSTLAVESSVITRNDSTVNHGWLHPVARRISSSSDASATSKW